MIIRTLSAAVLSTTGAALVAGALSYAPIGHADPGSEPTPPCIAEGTCKLIQKSQPKYLPLTPASTPQSAPLTPAH